LQEGSVNVQWMFPPRSRTVPQTDIARVGVARASHDQQRLILELRDGSRLYSARDAAGRIDLARPAVAPSGGRNDVH